VVQLGQDVFLFASCIGGVWLGCFVAGFIETEVIELS
jgi:hypothetical protein